ncbi:MAG: hypothetical protein PHU01_04720, partial [Desulfuromonadaceae bacterium]|nr:hypothetical protein [Desulfuromonadaceae bacterium]
MSEIQGRKNHLPYDKSRKGDVTEDCKHCETALDLGDDPGKSNNTSERHQQADGDTRHRTGEKGGVQHVANVAVLLLQNTERTVV